MALRRASSCFASSPSDCADTVTGTAAAAAISIRARKVWRTVIITILEPGSPAVKNAGSTAVRCSLRSFRLGGSFPAGSAQRAPGTHANLPPRPDDGRLDPSPDPVGTVAGGPQQQDLMPRVQRVGGV